MSSAIDIQDKKSPVRKKILETVGSYTFSADVQEDVQALSLLKRKGLVAFVVTLRRGTEVLSQGRAVGTINRWNRYFEKIIQSVASAALVDAVVKSTRADTLDTEASSPNKATSETAIGEAYQAKEEDADDMATARQVDYLKQLIQINLDDPEREERLAQVDELTKTEASQAIAQFANFAH